MKRRTSAGYSLIEVLVAIAITSVVLLTVVTLFYVGKRNVYGGKQRTYAVAAGTRMLEDLSAMTGDDVRTNFGLDDNSTLGTVTLTGLPPGLAGANGSGNMVVTNSVSRDSNACTFTNGVWGNCANDPKNYMAKWMKELSSTGNRSERLSNPVIGLIITPRLPTNNLSPVVSAQFTKIRLYLSWDEGSAGARRYAFFDTNKVF